MYRVFHWVAHFYRFSSLSICDRKDSQESMSWEWVNQTINIQISQTISPLKNVCSDLYIYLYNIPPFPIKQSRVFNHSRTAIEKQVQRGKPREENRFLHVFLTWNRGGEPVSHPFWTKNRGCETGFLSEIYLFVSLWVHF